MIIKELPDYPTSPENNFVYLLLKGPASNMMSMCISVLWIHLSR